MTANKNKNNNHIETASLPADVLLCYVGCIEASDLIWDCFMNSLKFLEVHLNIEIKVLN